MPLGGARRDSPTGHRVQGMAFPKQTTRWDVELET